MRVPIKGTNVVIEIDAMRDEVGSVSAVALFQLVQSICGQTKQQTKDTIDSLLESKAHLMQFLIPNGKRRDITVAGARRLIQEIGNGPFNPRKNLFYKTDRSKARHTINALRTGVIDAFDDAVARMNGSRIEEISADPGAAPSGPVGVAQSNDVDGGGADATTSTTAPPTGFWTDLVPSQTAAYEGAIERFFVHPHIEAVYARMVAFEQDEMESELALMCDACSQGFQPLGYVYVAWNVLFGHLLKIGFTMRTPAIRLRELSGAGVPEPFELVSYIQTPNPFALEKSIHRHFADVRKYGRRKEFFTLTREAAIAYFKTLGGHDAAERPPPSAPSNKRKAS